MILVPIPGLQKYFILYGVSRTALRQQYFRADRYSSQYPG